MRNWLKGTDAEGKEGKEGKRVVVVHCKAGKGRSGTVSCSYLISEEGWSVEDALKRFTERRMRPGFGAGVSIPSQLRWVGYVDRWTKHGKRYIERPVEVVEVHVWGLRDGVKVAVEGFVDEGRTIKNFHTFSKEERDLVRGDIKKSNGFADVVTEAMKGKQAGNGTKENSDEPSISEKVMTAAQNSNDPDRLIGSKGGDVVFRPSEPLVIPTSDLNIDFERRNKASYGFTMVTSVAHVWFNTYFEGNGPENGGNPDDSGVFEIEWDAMDGIKGSSRKGTRAFDKMAVVWKTPRGRQSSIVINEPSVDEEVKQTQPADWRGDAAPSTGMDKDLGLRAATPSSASVSRASSVRSHKGETNDGHGPDDEREGVKPYGAEGENEIKAPDSVLPLSKDLPGPTHEVAKGDDPST